METKDGTALLEYMEIRTYIATQAMVAIIQGERLNLFDTNPEQDQRIARRAAFIADAMIDRLSKP